MSLIPHRFLFRVAYPCPYVKGIPQEDRDELLDLPEACRLDNFAGLDGKTNFADVRVAWNELGMAVQVEVRGKDQPPQGDAARPRGADGVTLWLDLRDARTSHRASRFCYQLHFLPTGGGPDGDEPAFAQARINRAQQDAPTLSASGVPFRCQTRAGGYRLEAFLPAGILAGFDPEQHPRLGVCYAVRDAELGEQTLGGGPEFPYWEDPSLWSVLELVK